MTDPLKQFDFGIDNIEFIPKEKTPDQKTKNTKQDKSILFGFSELSTELADTIHDTKKEASIMKNDISRMGKDLEPVGRMIRKKIDGFRNKNKQVKSDINKSKKEIGEAF